MSHCLVDSKQSILPGYTHDSKTRNNSILNEVDLVRDQSYGKRGEIEVSLAKNLNKNAFKPDLFSA